MLRSVHCYLAYTNLLSVPVWFPVWLLTLRPYIKIAVVLSLVLVGNAGTGNYHLHFSISLVSDPKRYWEGTNINPYPLLTGKQ